MCVAKDIFILIGIITTIGCVFALCALAMEYTNDCIYNWKRTYQYKHRFDKPPTAKCYCIDCLHHDNETGRCYAFHEDSNRLTADCWFCYRAEPRKSMED